MSCLHSRFQFVSNARLRHGTSSLMKQYSQRPSIRRAQQRQRSAVSGSIELTQQQRKEMIRKKSGFIIDMDGVLYHGEHMLPGVEQFLQWIFESQKTFLFLTNSSNNGRGELAAKMERLTGFKMEKHYFYTSALATAAFLQNQTPNGTAYVIGSVGLINALYDAGYTINDTNPDYVVVGETTNFNFQMIERGVKHVRAGAKLIGTNRDIMDRIGTEFHPGTGSLITPIQKMTDIEPYFVGKPNPLIMSYAMKHLGTPYNQTVIIGDRMDTDIQAGIELGIDTVLVLSGVTNIADLGNKYAFKPSMILNGIGDLLEDEKEAETPVS